ncbi:TcpQ domain-containing protein [Castellaniella ginsengisoli]
MIRLLGAGLLLAGMGGCAAPVDGAWWRDLAGPPAPGIYRFDWRIAGDPALAPLQVFDDGHETWLQYPAGQPAPAVFERTARGDRLLRPRRDRDYLILRGVPARIVLRGGLSQAEAWRDPRQPPAPDTVSFEPVLPAAGEGPAVAARAAGHLAEQAPPGMDALPVTPAPVPAQRPRPAPLPVPPAPSAPAARAGDDPPGRNEVTSAARATAGDRGASFEVTPADGNVRRALGRWASVAGWTFAPEHWDVDADIPLAGSAAFGGSFRQAVRGLLSATELGDRPVQPCFYANRVLRVVPLAQRCDRTRAPGTES